MNESTTTSGSSISASWYLATIIEVPFDDRIQCQCKGCGRIVYKRVHLIVWSDSQIQCWGETCYARELGATPQGRDAKARYSSAGVRRLTPEERELLKDNQEQLIAAFRKEHQERVRVEMERQERLRRKTERERQESAHLVCEQSQKRQKQKRSVNAANIERNWQDTSELEPVTERAGICEFCGKKTSDWWTYDGKTGMCRCNECKRRGVTEPPEELAL